jgi:hypothetical protein
MNKRITLLAFMLCLLSGVMRAQVSITNTSPYTQDFNSLPNTGAPTTTNPNPVNWYRYAKTSTATNLTVYNMNVNTNTGGFYSAGDTAAATKNDRALGSLLSTNSKPLYYGVKFVNNTGSTIVSATISYKCEQWRRGNNVLNHPDSLLVEYNVGSDSIQKGTWTNIPQLMGTSANTDSVLKVLNGNTVFQNKSFTLTGLAIANGATFWIRFNDVDIFFSDDLLAVDDFSTSFTTGTVAACTEPANAVTNVVVSATSTTSVSGSFTGTTPAADGYLVVLDSSSTIPTITDATTYTAGQVLGSAVVLSNGTATTFSASGLAANTIYHAYVFPYNNTSCTGGPNYKTTSPGTDTAKTLIDACPEPSVKPTNLVFFSVSNNSIIGKFNKTTPAPTGGYIVVYSTSSNVAYPKDSATYAVNDSIKYSSYKSKVAYVGTDSNFTVNGLVSGTKYYFAVIPFNNCPFGKNYFTTSPLKNDTITGGTPPMTDCTQPTGVSTTSIVKLDSTMTTINIKWKNPTNADSIMILAGVSNTLGYVTIHDSAYYAVGTIIPGSGATVYYRGTDSTVVLSGLQSNTVYKILFAPFNNKGCSNGPNYGNMANITVKTAAGAPGDCTQPTGVSNTTIVKLDSTSSTIQLKWRNPANADSVMVLAGPSSTLGFVALHDSAYYAVGSVIPGSSATVYYRGTDSILTITGLQANTVYKIMIVPFNNKACNHGPNYANIAITSIKTAINTGVKYHNSEAEFALFPNPVNNGSIAVKFKSPLREEAVIEVLDIVGRKIETQKITQGTDMQTIDVSRLSKGTYIFNVVYKNTNNVSTFIIE